MPIEKLCCKSTEMHSSFVGHVKRDLDGWRMEKRTIMCGANSNIWPPYLPSFVYQVSQKNVGCLPIYIDATKFANSFLSKFIALGKG